MKSSELEYITSMLDIIEESTQKDFTDEEQRLSMLRELDQIVEVLTQEFKIRTSEKIIQLY